MIKRRFDKISEILREIVIDWGKANVYMVGGCIRDLQLGLPVKDIDLCIDCQDGATQFVEYLKNNRKDCKNFVVYPRFGTSKFSLSLGFDKRGNEILEDIECVMPRTETYNQGPRKPDSVEYTSLEIDAKRRDFCCNALYRNVVTGEILDPTGHGLQDIRDKILRTPVDAENTFIDDPLRMLRAIRFAHQKEFIILREVKEKLKPYPEYYKLSMERVRDEFSKILLTSTNVEAIWELHETGLLKYIIPEFEDAWGFNQNSKYHSMNLTDHILEVLRKVTKKKDLYLDMAALLHDISKYKEYQIKEDGTFSYHNHEESSSKMAEDILKRLKFSQDEINHICTLISGHMEIKQLYSYGRDEYTGKAKKTRALDRKYGNLLPSLMSLIDADNRSHAPEYCMPGQVSSFWIAYDRDVKNFQYLGTQLKNTQPISGEDIMKRYPSLKPGKVIGEIKDILQDLYDGDPSQTKEELFRVFDYRFKDKEFWVWFDGIESICATFLKPRQGQLPGLLENGRCESVLVLDDSEAQRFKNTPTWNTKVSALEYPALYLRLRIHHKSRELLDKVADLCDEFYEMPGFNGIHFSLDECRDLSAEIKWKGHRSDYIC